MFFRENRWIRYYELNELLKTSSLYRVLPSQTTQQVFREEHTSKCSFLDGEPIAHHEQYFGTRTTRRLFKSKSERIINADCNGAYNIVRKEAPNAFVADGIEGVGLHPVLVKL